MPYQEEASRSMTGLIEVLSITHYCELVVAVTLAIKVN